MSLAERGSLVEEEEDLRSHNDIGSGSVGDCGSSSPSA